VAKKLAEFLLENKSSQIVCRQNRKFLFEKIFDENNVTFRDEVLEGTDPSLNIFRSAFEYAFNASIKTNKILKDCNKRCWEYWRQQSIEEKLKLINSAGDADKDQKEFDTILKRFVEDVSSQYQVLTTNVKNWFTGPNKANPLTKEVYEEFFNKSELDYQKNFIIELKETLFEDFVLEFVNEYVEIKRFYTNIGSQSQKILQVITPESEESFISMRILSNLSSAPKDSFVMLRSSLSSEVIERGLNVFKSGKFCNLLILQIDPEKPLSDENQQIFDQGAQVFEIEDLPDIRNNCLNGSLRDHSKRLIVITDLNSKVNFKSSDFQEFQVAHSFPKDLEDASLNIVLNREVDFQKHKTTWKEIAEKDYLKNDILLKDLLQFQEIADNVQVFNIFNKDLYVERTFIYQHWLKPEVLNNFNDEFVYNEEEFESKRKSKNIHWLEKIGANLKWIKTTENISEILKFINEEKKEGVKEEKFTMLPSRVSVLVDVAGMGKSTALDRQAQLLKKKHPHKWIMKINLNDYTNELEEATMEGLKTTEGVLEFLSKHIFKMETNLEEELFKHSSTKTGNVILLFDGFDEVASYYKDQVSQLIKSLLKTSIGKIIIASRPECGDYLEKTFSQIRYSLLPFTKEDQENFLFNFMKEKVGNVVDEDLLKKIIQMILGSMAKSFSDKDFKFTGVPLITKLVAEFFESKINGYFQKPPANDFVDFIAKLEKETFNLVKLYDHFVEKKLQIYHEEKCKLILSNPRVKRMIQQLIPRILKNYKTLAVKQILKTDAGKYFPAVAAIEFDEEELEDLERVGLIYTVNNDWKFVHQTIGEFGFNRFLNDSFDDENCAKFIVEVVLVDDSYQIIRSFMNFWILEKVSENSCEMYQEKLLEISVQNKETPLHVAGREGNENIFWFLYSSLAAKSDRFANKTAETEDYLLNIPKGIDSAKSYTAFAHYFQNCNDSFVILREIQKDFGIDFVKQLFRIKMNTEENILHKISESDWNILEVLTFLRETFGDDLGVLREIFCWSRDMSGRSFLHVAFRYLHNATLIKLFDELDLLKSILGQGFIDQIVLIESSDIFGVFLSLYARSQHFDNDTLMQFLKRMRAMCGQETLKRFFVISHDVSRPLLHRFCYEARNFNLLQIFQWLNREFGRDFLKELIPLTDHIQKQTVFHNLLLNPTNPGSQILPILAFLKHDLKFEDEFLVQDILFNTDHIGRKVFSNLLFTQSRDFYQSFFEFLEQHLNFTHETLENRLKDTKLLPFHIAQYGKSARDEIAELFGEKFGDTFISDHFYSTEILFELCKHFLGYSTDKFLAYFNFVEEQTDLQFLENYVSRKNDKNQTILFFYHQRNYRKYLVKILNWFEAKFGDDRRFLEGLLLEVDGNGDSFLMSVLKECLNSHVGECFTETYHFLIRHFDIGFVGKFLLIENCEMENCINHIYSDGDQWKITGILDLLFDDFQSDHDFFKLLINEKLRENPSVREWMRRIVND
jgi:hypothetical protein